jgi:hypothetical protein
MKNSVCALQHRLMIHFVTFQCTIQAAKERGDALRRGPLAESAHYDAEILSMFRSSKNVLINSTVADLMLSIYKPSKNTTALNPLCYPGKRGE